MIFLDLLIFFGAFIYGAYQELKYQRAASKIKKKYGQMFTKKVSTTGDNAPNLLQDSNRASSGVSNAAIDWYNQGVEMVEQGYQDSAVEYFNKALSLNPNDFDSWYGKGSSLLDLKRYVEAETCFRKAIELDPRSADSYYGLALTLEALNRPTEAANAYRQYAKLAPFQDMKDIEYARQRAAELAPDQDSNENEAKYFALVDSIESASEAYNLALKYQAKGDYELALVLYDYVLKDNQNNDDALYGKASCLFQMGNLKDAYDCYKKLLALLPNDSDALYGLALVLDSLGQQEEAVKFYEAFLSNMPEMQDERYEYARSRLLQLRRV